MPDNHPPDPSAAPAEDPLIQDTMAKMGALVGSDWVSAFDYDLASRAVARTFRWVHPAFREGQDQTQRLSLEDIPDWDFAAHLAGRPIWIPDTRLLPDGTLRGMYSRQGMTSVLALPVMEAGTCRGFVQFAWRGEKGAYSATELALLGFLADLLVGALRSERSEKALRESEALLRESQRAAATGSFRSDLASGDWTCSEVLERMLGLTPAPQHSRAEWDAVVHPDDQAGLIRHLVEDVIGQGKPMDREYRIIPLGAGGARWVHSAGLALPGGQGPILIGTTQDINARKLAELERERLLQAVEQAAEAIVITDTAGVIEYVNPAFERATGYSRAEALGRNPRMLKSGEQARGFYAELWGTISSGRIWKGRLCNRRKDGSLFTEEATISPVLGPDGTIRNYVAVKHDISEKLRLEAQFLQAQKMESIGRLAGGVAHDFNNMLGVIFSLTEMELEAADPSQPLHASLQGILNAAQRSANLTRQLLTFARKQPASPQLLDLNATVGAMLGMLGRLIGEQIDLRWEPQAGLGWVRMDPVQLDQVIVNLCVNARDAIRGVGALQLGTVRVDLDAAFCAERPGLRPGPHVMLSVKDNGAGMDPATLAQVFEPFFSTKGLGKGSGLGLATVYGIISQNGGFIEAASAPGLGALFSIYLPRFEEGPAPAAPAPGLSPLRPAQSTILLVEDEPALLALTQRMLEGLGHRVLPARAPGEALKLARGLAGSVHLLVTDVVMPEMNGLDLARAALKLHPELRCVFMSGYSADIIASHGVLDEGVNFLPKPFTLDQLAGKIREAMQKPA